MTTTPPIQGVTDQRFAAVRDAFAHNFTAFSEVGAALAVTVDGALVVDLWGGYLAPGQPAPWQRDTLVNLYSTSKGIGALCAHILVERGQLDLDAPVASYWPEFAQQGKDTIPVRWLLSHRAGLPAVESDLPREAMYDWHTMTTALAAQKPWWEPGTAHGYHALTYSWLLGEVIKRVAGKSVGAFFRDEVAQPLALDAHIGLGPVFDSRIADIIPAPPPSPGEFDRLAAVFEDSTSMPYKAFNNPPLSRRAANTREWRAAELVAANAHANAWSLARMYAALANGGALPASEEHPAVRLLSAATIDAARAEQSRGDDMVLHLESRFGLSFMLPAGMRYFSDNPRAFGHSGMGGSLAFADPEARLSVAYVMNQLLTGVDGGDRRWWGFLSAIYEALGSTFTVPAA